MINVYQEIAVIRIDVFYESVPDNIRSDVHMNTWSSVDDLIDVLYEDLLYSGMYMPIRNREELEV